MHNRDEIQIQSAPHGSWLSFEKGSVVVGGKISLKGGKDDFFCADEASQVRCHRSSVVKDAAFEVVDAGGGKIALKGGRAGKYCADTPTKMVCNSDTIGEGETFSVEDLGGDRVALKGDRSGRYCTDGGRLQGVKCASSDLTQDAKFELVLESAQGAEVVQTLDQTGAGTFVVTRADLNSPVVALLCKGQGLYLTVRPDGLLSCASPLPKGFDFSRVATWDARVGALRAQAGEIDDADNPMYLRALDPAFSAEVKANGQDPNGWQQFNILLVAGLETVRPLIRGVNLANWFILDKPMSNELWLQQDGATPFAGQCDAIDERSLMQSLGREVAQARMEAHWETWITEDDIGWLAKRNLNAVRVPIGYWMVLPEAPFVGGQYRHLRNLFEWCEKYNIAVLLDFHGLKGSQNGEPSSGNCGACGNDNCGRTSVDYLEHRDENLAVIRNLTMEFSASPVYLGFQVANEISRTTDRNAAVDFYKDAYALIRAWSPGALDVMPHSFGPSNFPFANFHDAVHDQHISFPRLPGGATADQHHNLNLILQELNQVERWQVVVGDWSLHSVQQWDDGFYTEFAKMQLQAYEQHSQGWFYQAYKTAYEDSKVSYRDQCERGRLPGCGASTWTLASGEWWGAAACTYAYLDGPCSPPSASDLLLRKQPPTDSGSRGGRSGSTRGIKVRRAPSAKDYIDARGRWASSVRPRPFI